ncbi:hypothetical protein PoB_003642300 [Plakobranchus ocellatus]|uniref:Uncharacterized protein n=1 Tax=Plakobranchus ocellatus TaxID=259542 RepID=A0AAV4ASY5_9GAST|nr:hypothetical protein PoB_003642300 [Plakobranchus ocellatus]
MGNLCDCFNTEKDGPTPKTPLLTAAQPPAVTVTSPVKESPPPAAQSARLHKPETAHDDFLTSLEEISQIEMKAVSTVPSLDKTFQDHAKLYNDLYTNFTELRQCLHNFKASFEKETAGIPTIFECLKLLAKRCGGATLTGSRSKNCIQIDCDRREVSEKCEGPAEDVLEIIETYNRANRLIRSLQDKGPQVRSSVRLVLEQEATLKKEVTKADPDGKMGPEPLKAASENFSRLHRLPAYIDTIQKYTAKTFKEIANGSRVLFEES